MPCLLQNSGRFIRSERGARRPVDIGFAPTGSERRHTRTTVTFCCQYVDAVGLNPERKLFEDNAQYVRTAFAAYNAVFDDMGDISKPEYLIRIVEDSITRGKK